MGDRYELALKCVYCGETNKDIWYAPTSSSDTFECKNCKKFNFISANFKSVKIENVTINMIIEGFDNTTMGTLTDAEIKKICKERFKEIQNSLIKT